MKKIVTSLVVAGVLAVSAQAFTLGKYGNFEFKKDHANVYIMHGPVMDPNKENEGFMNNPTIIEGEHGLIIVDPGGNYNVGKKILAEIEKVSKKPIIATINTHKHGDHWFANKALLEKYPDLKIYAHPNMIKVVKEGGADQWYGILESLTGNLKGTNNPFPFPNMEVLGGKTIEIDGQKFEIFHPERAHTDTDIVITHLNSDTMFMGDNVMKGRLGGFDASSNIQGNIALLKEIEKEPEHKTYIPGHGPSGKMHETLDPFIGYMTVIVEEAKRAYDNDLESYEVKEDAIKRLKAYHKWDDFEGKMGKHLMKAYEEWEALDM